MKGRVAWLVPAPLKGSGGHRTIFQKINALVDVGYECHVFLQPPPPRTYSSAEHGRELVEQWFGEVHATFHLGFDLDREYDIGFATAWFTAEPLKASKLARRKAYFIQDYEAYFMPMSDGFIQAENSYRYHFHGTTIGRWLAHRLGEGFGMDCIPFDFCADHAVYHPLPAIEREKAVCFVFQPEKPRRCSVVGGNALAIVKREMPDVKIYFYGNATPPELPFEVEHLGLLSIERCNELYNRCQVGLCISATNPSRIPFEMMAAGLPVVDVHRDNTLYDMPDEAVLLAEQTPESIAHALLQILGDSAERENRTAAGLAFMKDRDLAHGFRQFIEFVDGLMRGTNGAAHALPTKLYRKAAVVAPPEVAARYCEPFAPPPPTPSFVARTQLKLQQTLRSLLGGR